MDLGTQVKSQLPEELISKTSTIDEHPEIKKRIQLIEEIRELRRSIGSLGRSTTDMGGGAITGYGEIDRDRQAALERAGSGYGIGSSGGYYNGNDRTRVKSMIAMPTGRPLSTPLPYQLHSYQQYGPQQQQQQQQQSSSSHSGTMTPPATIRRPGSAPLTRGEEWETYVSERKLFTPPAGVTAPIQPSPLPEGLKANTRIVPSEAVSAAVEERKRRESLFGLGSDKDASGRNSSSSGGGGGGGGGSGLGLKLGGENGTGRRSSLLGLDFMLSSRTGEGGQPESPSSPPPPRISTGDSPVTPPVAGPSSPSRGTHSHRRSRSLGNVFSRLTLNKNDPPVVLPPQRSASPPPTPQPRVVTYEELQERHKAKMKRMQEPISRAATEEATLAEARSRWERSKAIEKEVMERKLAEAQAKLKDRGGVGTRVGSHRRSLSQTQVPERNPLSLERLKSAAGGGGLGRMSASSKVEEWRKYRTTTTTTTTTTPPAGAGARTSAEVDEDQPLAQLQSQQKDVGGAGIGVGVGVGGARRRSVSGNRMSLSGGLEYERRRSTSGGLLGGVAAAAAAAAAPTGVPPSSPK
ncbi:uncharacterized protein EI90DRAFT_3058138 [Cantharellus anzutake]|uniref:uncharacterized protein n=1 Tax=Cantharellus anzutake TaxID=1750568 RepID=UPI001904FB0E|nr:uncharacterized protein EI90DRAFT_3058138 [Cantharellus anzutake]KAF8331510.1 hypothetical protein EI90DRAFT_3058138 [Cantharellus anzutake]